jgi:hypothetical protein
MGFSLRLVDHPSCHHRYADGERNAALETQTVAMNHASSPD